MKKKNTHVKVKKALKIVDKIQKIRSKNNINWMNLLRLAIKSDYESTMKIVSNIFRDDQKISKLAKKLYTLK